MTIYGRRVVDKALLDYKNGEDDCKKGIDADRYRGEHYQCGYNFQYGIEQIRTNKTERQENECK